jgi:subtilisin family serine protease
MSRVKRAPVITCFSSIALLICVCVCGALPTGRTHAQSERALDQTQLRRIGSPTPELSDESESASPEDKISPDLRELMEAHAGNDVQTLAANNKDDVTRTVVQLNQPASANLNALLGSGVMSEKGRFSNLNTMVLEMRPESVTLLAGLKEVRYISLDRTVEMHGHVATTAGAVAMRQITANSGIDGTGIAIAVLDSGMFRDHDSFKDRILANVDFTGAGNPEDAYGHGSHVAGLAAGDALLSNGAYAGIAPRANLVNLRVLDGQGRGTTSAVMSALDWVMTNRAKYNIRVVNMSLGCLAIDSYINDPLCRAVRRLVDAGVVVVAAAGNNGKDSNGNKVYGLIHSPGNEPSAITVGATDTKGTDPRSDDAIATYSSRGPTRSYWTDPQGKKHFDNLIKPDLVAPGNKLYSTEANNNLLVTTNPELDNPYIGSSHRDMMMLSGTSMATPVVAGTAALLLQANPYLTPNLVKAILMYTAQPLPGANMLEQGAGEINIEGAVRLAKLVRTTLNNSTALGSPLLISDSLPVPQSTIAGQTFYWSQGLITNYDYVTGTNLISKYQIVYGLGTLLGDGFLLSDGHLLCDSTMMSSGILLGESILTSNGVLLGDGIPFISCGMLLGGGILLGDGMVLGDGVLLGDGILLGNGILLGDFISQCNKAQINGDNSPGMRPVP